MFRGTFPPSIQITGSNGSDWMGVFYSKQLGEVRLYLDIDSFGYDETLEEPYIQDSGMQTTLSVLHEWDATGVLLDRVLEGYQLFRGKLPHRLTSEFADLDKLFKVFPGISSTASFLERFTLCHIIVFTQESKSDSAFSISFRCLDDSFFLSFELAPGGPPFRLNCLYD